MAPKNASYVQNDALERPPPYAGQGYRLGSGSPIPKERTPDSVPLDPTPDIAIVSVQPGIRVFNRPPGNPAFRGAFSQQHTSDEIDTALISIHSVAEDLDSIMNMYARWLEIVSQHR